MNQERAHTRRFALANPSAVEPFLAPFVAENVAPIFFLLSAMM